MLGLEPGCHGQWYGVYSAAGAVNQEINKMTHGRVNPDFTLEDQGIKGLGTVWYNLIEPDLISESSSPAI